MSGNFKNDIKTTGFVKSSKIGPLIGSVEELPTPSAEYEGITLQYLGETVSEFLRKSNMYICKKQADDTYAWEDNSPAGGGKWGKIIGNVEDQTDLVARIQAILDNAAEDSTHTWTASQLKAKFAALEGVASVVVVPSMPSTPVLNTIYYVGTESPYHIWLYAKNESGEAKWFDFGTTEISLDDYYTKDTVDDKFDDEVAARDAAIAVEKTARENAVNAEITARTNAVSAEATTRESADDILSSSIGAETTARTSADAALQVNIDKKQNKVIYVDTLPDPSTLETGDLVIKDADDGYWSKVNPDQIIDDTTTSGEKTWSSVKIISEAEDRYAKKGECPLPIGGVLTTKDVNFNPSTKWSGTTWEALPDYKEWDEVSETVIANPTGVTGVVAYSVHCNVVTVKFDAIKCAEPVKNYFFNMPTKYNPNANQLCVVLNAWDDDTTKTFACVCTGLSGNIYLRRISNTVNTQYGFISYPCGGGTPDRTYKRYKRLT